MVRSGVSFRQSFTLNTSYIGDVKELRASDASIGEYVMKRSWYVAEVENELVKEMIEIAHSVLDTLDVPPHLRR